MSKKIQKIEGPYRPIESREFDSNAEFNPKPSLLVLVAVLEISVRDEYGDYLLVVNPHYEEIEVLNKRGTTRCEDGFWTVPYVTKTLPAPSGGWLHLKSAASAMDKAVKEWDPQQLIETYASTFSFGAHEIHYVGAFCEFKHSWTQPHMMKLYHIMRYSMALESPLPGNIADGASRKGYSFLPIDERYKAVTNVIDECPVHSHRETVYRSHPLATNLAFVLDDEDRRSAILGRATELERDHFSRDFTGLLLCGDIAGYGAASSYAEQKMSDFTSDNLGAVLRDSATIAFTDLFLEAGIDQIHIAGDGFICAIPIDASTDKQVAAKANKALKRFAKAYAKYLKSLQTLSERIASHYESNHGSAAGAPLLGSRLALHYGGYRYGKISQAMSLVTSFDGSQIVAVSRLEQALRSITKDPQQAAKYKAAQSRHTAAASPELLKLLAPGTTVLDGLFKKGQRFQAASKEYQKPAWLLTPLSNAPPRRPRAGALRSREPRPPAKRSA